MNDDSDGGLCVIAVWILALPIPGISAHARKVVFCNPAQFGRCFIACCIVLRDIARPAFDDPIRQLLATRLLEGLDNLKHARARARSQVEDRNTAARAVFGHRAFDAAQPDRFTGADFATHEIERFHVPARKIDHMNVVAHARAVGSRIIVAEDLDAFELARGNLRHIGKQVVRDALRVFADPAAFMRTDRVEVTQDPHGADR